MKKVVLSFAAAAVCAVAAPASAQSWGGDYGGRWGDEQRYAFRDYPEFRGEIVHLQSEVREGVEEGWLDDDQARAMGWRLRRIQQREAGEFREHGWNLPDGDRDEIRRRLDDLDRQIDQLRDES